MSYFHAIGAACLLSTVPVMAQSTAAHNHQTQLSKGASIAIEGCVEAGLKKDTYLIGSVKEVPGAPVETGRWRIYWLDSTKHLKGHVGHMVQISGRIKDLERSEMEVELGAGEDGGAVAKIEGPGMAEVRVPAASVGTSTAGQTKKEVDIPITLVKIHVDKVTMIKAGCGA
ncbi:MAG: hypothetical protein M3R55_05630 [Acidobacteriota bacterium]|nr:hypothetical protein [Acidobacteriota bacterium]